MITRKLAHQLMNRCQVILGRIELGYMEQDNIARQMHLKKAKEEIQGLVSQIRESIGEQKS